MRGGWRILGGVRLFCTWTKGGSVSFVQVPEGGTPVLYAVLGLIFNDNAKIRENTSQFFSLAPLAYKFWGITRFMRCNLVISDQNILFFTILAFYMHIYHGHVMN